MAAPAHYDNNAYFTPMDADNASTAWTTVAETGSVYGPDNPPAGHQDELEQSPPPLDEKLKKRQQRRLSKYTDSQRKRDRPKTKRQQKDKIMNIIDNLDLPTGGGPYDVEHSSGTGASHAGGVDGGHVAYNE